MYAENEEVNSIEEKSEIMNKTSSEFIKKMRTTYSNK